MAIERDLRCNDFARLVESRAVPSLPHELLVDILRERPLLLLSLLRSKIDVVLPEVVVARESAASIVDLRPAEYRADAVLVFGDGTELPLLAVVVEVQLHIDPEKAFTYDLLRE